jgi:hypothetical protein
MNLRVRRYSKFISIAVLTAAFLISSEIPLLAGTPQSSQPNASDQKPDNSLPDAPQSQPAQTTQQPPSTPSGAAGAKAANAKGSPAALPAGAAVAPVRQRGHRSLLIKIGLIAGAGIAAGAVVALSEKSPARPVGTSSSVRP